jgi:K+-transporting ATPase ATPase C chain
LANVVAAALYSGAVAEGRGWKYCGLVIGDIPVDSVTTSASGIDPHISPANATLQTARVAKERGLTVERVQELIDDHTDGRWLGLFGEPGVNVLELNLALDEETA